MSEFRLDSDLMEDSLMELIRKTHGDNTEILSRVAVGGGDINEAYRLQLTDGRTAFLKVNRSRGEEFFRAEALGLAAIADTGAIGCPGVYGYGRDQSVGGAFLLMEDLESSSRCRDYWEEFAKNLALMHSADTTSYVAGGRYGFVEDNYIGATPQRNKAHGSWVDLFREERLAPQFEMCDKYFSSADRRSADRLLTRLDDLLVEPDKGALIHGDLWSGNFITGPDGKAWLIDPATYVGCAEADIAMTELFGGFSPEFYEAYREYGVMMDGYEDRVELYNLYHLLNHLNLFGSGYLGSVMRIVKRYS